ncbi:MAG TPA: tRNA preQ1(34) S-adenosylmethionine ribosyltransferase-isomerase QueA [Legionellaceae bacterium]|nr:tRNA preQ1(34) S-adenosylmethionine ribosyltransferase-isomerase QueA [Legionellaceae bacterium]
MRTSDFYFDLPEKLIAQFPLPNRSDSRMLVYQRASEALAHRSFTDLLEYLNPQDLLVFNDSRVIPARLYGHKATGGRVEVFVERLVAKNECWAHIRASKTPKAGTIIFLTDVFYIEVLEKKENLYRCKASHDIEEILEAVGHMPLPPYISRQEEPNDLQRYQTIYAKHKGSVAAPTAGLHFDETMFARLAEKGVRIAYTTLHVGAGTFQPVRCDDINQHHMHTEWFTVDKTVCTAVESAKREGGRVIAVGTTALRSLESAACMGVLTPCQRETNIFIKPGYRFQICDGLMTNFHLPESTLLMLVSAFIGYEQTMRLYRSAIEQQYRFFSYGDVSLLL